MAETARTNPIAERRKARRVSTLRQVLFEKLTGTTRGHEGVVVDLSRDGLQVRTRMPAAVGDLLFLDVDPKPEEPSSTRIEVEGRVVWVCPDRGHGAAMGVAIRRRTPAKVADSFVAGGGPGSLIEAASLALPAHAGDSTTAEAARPVRIRKVEEEGRGKKRRRLAACLLLLCGLLLLLLFGLGRSKEDGPFQGRLGPMAAAEEAPEEVEPDLPLLIPEPAEEEALEAVDGVVATPRSVRPVLSGAMDRDMAPARPFVPERMGVPPSGTEGRVFASLARPSDAGVSAPHNSGAPVLVSAQGRSGDDIQVDVAAQPVFPRRGAPRGASGRVEVPVREELGVGGPLRDLVPQGGVAILVNKATFTMVVFKDRRAIRRFPVGVGKNDATPEGTFVIANKIRNPDWYDHGRVVEAGDPENPLGASWMGLGDKSPTSYGIHPTDEPESVGRPMSRGCIRMYPEDAETVFRFCPVGTPVVICDSGPEPDAVL